MAKIVSEETKRSLYALYAGKLAGQDWHGKRIEVSSEETNKNRTPQGFERGLNVMN